MIEHSNFIKDTFVKGFKPSLYIKTVILSILSGVLSFIYITFVNSIMVELIEGSIKFKKESMILLVFTLLCFIWTRKMLSTIIINFSQAFLWDIRLSLIQLTLKSNFEYFKSHQNKVYASLVGDVPSISQASLNIIHFSGAFVMLIACFVYIWNISHVLCIITIGVVILGATVYQLSSRLTHKHLINARKIEDDFMQSFNAVMSGFKEIFMDYKKGEELFEGQIKPISKASIFSSKKALIGLLNNQIIGQMLFYSLMGVTLTVFVGLFHLDIAIVLKYIFILLFLLGSVEAIMALLPSLIQSKISYDKISALQISLDSQKVLVDEVELATRPEDFKEIQINELEYEYNTMSESNTIMKRFKVGPISLNISKGDVLFIYGGNGSGKTTFISTFLGLLKPQKGQIFFNNEQISETKNRSYKMMFGVVFSDFYLFDGLYSIDSFDLEKANDYLKLFEIDHVVSFQGKKFSTTTLSTGQRKRLALISILLEKKPVIVLDEWAADQDPQFRNKFYTKIIPLIISEGYTIVAITHDDKYYHCANKLYEMQDGNIKPIHENIHQPHYPNFLCQ
ncbi:cyclic peptide transporter [Chryseobacterium sp. 52]|uniref:cyclic peptide export ABC transporter n=1 Tax=Chryseobacterium sp. 52 TaxID=2035213 RepID=UPI000C174668|nr:cyclic peptide export ABC transporter [Chryseobacterium sp. 52]PIF44691.1 cyclic peptide transporter [Chryseobacterium sp. 52]